MNGTFRTMGVKFYTRGAIIIFRHSLRTLRLLWRK